MSETKDTSTEPERPGILGSLRTVLSTVFEVIQIRAELFAVEAREGKCRLVGLLAWFGGLLVAVFMALFALTAAVILVFEGTARVWAAVICGLVYLGGAAFAYCGVRSRLRAGGTPFSETVAQLKKDGEWLKSLR